MPAATHTLAGRPAAGRHRPDAVEGADELLAYPDDDDTSWLLPYVDVVSLLLAFVILVLASSKVNPHRFEMLSSALSTQGPPPSLESLRAELDRTLRKEKLDGEVATTLDAEGLRIEFKNTLLFASGEAVITTEGRGVLDRVLAVLPSLDPRYQIAIEGHTDDVPIHTERFSSNWDLSTVRAVKVLEAFLVAGLEARRLSAQGYADTRPARTAAAMAGTDAEQLARVRAENRRVVIRVH